MKKFSKKVVSALTALALTATMSAGVASFVGCSESNAEFGKDSGKTQISIKDDTYTVSTVFGSKTVRALRTLYVAPDGTGEGTEANPASITSVLSGSNASVQAGDKVVLKDGTYEFSSILTISKSGTYDQPITIVAENEGKAILSFYKETYGTVGISIDADFVNLIGIVECGAGANGIRVRGNYNLVENCESFDNRNTGIQITRTGGSTVDVWPGYNLVKNCTSHNNYDYKNYGEDADGFAAKLTLGYGNVFDGCIAYRNSDDGWDLYARNSSGEIGAVYIYNSVAFENGFIEYQQADCIARYPNDTGGSAETTRFYYTADGDGNGFKLGGEGMQGDVFVYNCLSFSNRMHGFTDNSNPGFLSVSYCTAVDNSAKVDDDPTSSTFGKVIQGYDSGHQSNFDLSRAAYSYNHLDHCLSVKTDMLTLLYPDYIRGSVQDSILFTDAGGQDGTTNVNIKVEGSIDADSRNGILGEEMSGLISAEDIFTKIYATVETVEGVSSYTYNITGCQGRVQGIGGDTDINAALRNADGSINMGDYFKIKDQSALLGETNPIGAVLDKSSYEEYSHYDMTDFTSYESAVQVRLQAAKDMLYVQTDGNAVYQDFDALSKIYGCIVTWESSDPEILEVSKEYSTSVSDTEYIPIRVHRPLEDTEVTLTATINYYGSTIQKDIVLNVAADAPVIGDISVIGPTGEEISNGDSIIVDKYTALKEPEISVLNAADYNGKLIDETQAEFSTKYEFGDDIAALNSGKSKVVSGFTTAQDGAFKITMTVKLTQGVNAGDSVEFVYYVIVASNTANVDFLDGVHTVVVNSQGYNISGDLTSAIGTIYSYTSDTKLDNVSAETVIANGAAQSFRATRVSFDFANSNLGEYYIYTVFVNGNRETTSEVYEDKISVINISTCDAFYQMAQHPMDIADDVAVSTIYALTADLDFTDYTYAMYNPTGFDVLKHGFKGFFNGNGHTISNITINSTGIQYTGIFRSLSGGTVTNVNFNNISVSGEQEKIGGIFATVYYGNVSYVKITNVTVLATQSCARIGGLAGAITSDNYPVRIDHVSIINDISAGEGGAYTAQIGGALASQRVGALVGYVQTGSSDRHMDVIISDCYTSAIVIGGSSVAGIAGNYDDRNAADYLLIKNCFTECVLSTYSTLLGGYRGTGNHDIIGCATANILNTTGNKSYYCTGENGAVASADAFKTAEFWTALGFDLSETWTLDAENGGILLKFTLGG